MNVLVNNLPIKKILTGISCSSIVLLLVTTLMYGQEPGSAKPKLIVFYSLSCHSCLKIKKEVIPEIEKKYKDKITMEYRDLADVGNYKLLLSLEEKYKSQLSKEIPIFYLEGNFLNGEKNIKSTWEKFIAQAVGRQAKEDKEGLPSVDLVKRFRSFTPLAIIAVGLIDGINPCAITVIVFFISFLATQGYRKKEIIVIGLLFIFSVYLTYLLVGLGIFGALYKLREFWLLTKIVNITVGVISIAFSFYALYDFIQYRKTNTTDSLLALPQSIKNQIHRVIGWQYRVHPKFKGSGSKKQLIGLALSALVTGFLVSVLEAVCVAKIYLPTIIFVLKTTSFKLKALVYLLLYNFLFIVPLLIVLFFALAGTTWQKFQAVLKGHLGAIKILTGIMFLGLGIFLIYRA